VSFLYGRAALMVGSVLSAGGLTALVVKRLGAKKGIKEIIPRSQIQGENMGEVNERTS